MPKLKAVQPITPVNINTEEQQRLIHALKGATEGIAAAVEQESITSTQIDCLLSTLINQLQTTIN